MKIVNNELKNMAEDILKFNSTNACDKSFQKELEGMISNDVRIQQIAYGLSIIESIRVIANGELGIPECDRLELIRLITERLKDGPNKNNIIEFDFTNNKHSS